MRIGLLLLALVAALAAKDPTECEVCIASLNTIKDKAKNKKDHLSIEEAVDNYCAKPPSEKENKLCYFINPIKREISQPMKNGVPTDTICQRLKKKSAEICSLRFKSTALPPVDKIEDLGKLRVKELRQLIADNAIPCKDCIEKADFVAAIKKWRSSKAKSEL